MYFPRVSQKSIPLENFILIPSLKYNFLTRKYFLQRLSIFWIKRKDNILDNGCLLLGKRKAFIFCVTHQIKLGMLTRIIIISCVTFFISLKI